MHRSLAEPLDLGVRTAWINLQHFGSSAYCDATPCDSTDYAVKWSLNRVWLAGIWDDLGDWFVLMHGVTDVPLGLPPTSDRRVDEAIAAVPGNLTRFAGKRQGWPFPDDCPKAFPCCLDRDINVVTGDETGAKANRERSKPAKPFRLFALAHPCIDEHRNVQHLDKRWHAPIDNQRDGTSALEQVLHCRSCHHTLGNDASKFRCAVEDGIGECHAPTRGRWRSVFCDNDGVAFAEEPVSHG